MSPDKFRVGSSAELPTDDAVGGKEFLASVRRGA
jgi:hypothetical protein